MNIYSMPCLLKSVYYNLFKIKFCILSLSVVLFFSCIDYSFAASGEYYVYNKTSKTLYYSIARFSFGSSSTSAGLPMYTPKGWYANGWKTVKPGTKKRIAYGGEFYLSIDPQGPKKIIDFNRKYGHNKATFCVSNKKYRSYSGEGGVTLDIDGKNVRCYKNNCSCSDLGGYRRTFYRIKDQSGYSPLAIHIIPSDV